MGGTDIDYHFTHQILPNRLYVFMGWLRLNYRLSQNSTNGSIEVNIARMSFPPLKFTPLVWSSSSQFRGLE
jgi:hypothetical protein